MKFTIDNEHLQAELAAVKGIIERKTTIPILSHVLLTAKRGEGLRLIGTDLDAFIVCPVEAKVQRGGSVAVDAKLLLEMTRDLKGIVAFERAADGKLNIQAGAIDVSLELVNGEAEFPNVPACNGKSTRMTVDADALRQMIRDTSFALAHEELRFVLNGAKFESGPAKDKTLKVVATDGHRLAFTATHGTKGKMDALIPKVALALLPKVVGNGKVQIVSDKSYTEFESNGRRLITRNLVGTFPHYEMIMPKDNDKTIKFAVADIQPAVKRASESADHHKAIKITFTDGQAKVTAERRGEATRSETVPVGYAGDEVTFGFNAMYLLDFLNLAKGKQAVLSCKGPSDQIEMNIDGYEYDYRYVVMPLRI